MYRPLFRALHCRMFTFRRIQWLLDKDWWWNDDLFVIIIIFYILSLLWFYSFFSFFNENVDYLFDFDSWINRFQLSFNISNWTWRCHLSHQIFALLMYTRIFFCLKWIFSVFFFVWVRIQVLKSGIWKTFFGA